MFTKGLNYSLNKNLPFCPSPGQYNYNTFKKDFKSFNRKINLKAFFHNKNDKSKKPNKQTKNQVLKEKPTGKPERTIIMLKQYRSS